MTRIPTSAASPPRPSSPPRASEKSWSVIRGPWSGKIDSSRTTDHGSWTTSKAGVPPPPSLCWKDEGISRGGGDVNELFSELDQRVPPATVLGYLNFSDGRPDPRWQKQLHDAFAFLADRRVDRPWDILPQWLRRGLASLHAGGGSA